MNEKDFADIIRLVRRAPLQNMDEAEVVAALLNRFARLGKQILDGDKIADEFPNKYVYKEES